jgi:hypothetical protein
MKLDPDAAADSGFSVHPEGEQRAKPGLTLSADL